MRDREDHQGRPDPQGRAGARRLRARTSHRAGLALILLCLPWLAGGSRDPGVVLELDRSTFELRARDLATGAEAQPFRLVLGSPAHPTPSGSFPLHVVVRNPAWNPGAYARSQGAEPVPPSRSGPLGIGKIPFAAGGEIALHGGADPILLGKPVSLGCARATDRDLLRLLGWLEERKALAEPRGVASGELHQTFLRPARVVVR